MKFKHLTYQQRCVIQEKIKEKKSYQQIADRIGKTKAAIAYEVKNKRIKGEYRANYAQDLTELRRASANSLRAKYANQKLINWICKLMKRKRSPRDIAMRSKDKLYLQKDMQISHETIYKIVFNFKNNKNFKHLADLYQYLPRKNKKRHIRGHLNPYRAYNRYWRSIHRMPARLKKSFGVWQIDVMHIFKGYILVCVEVVSKKVMALPIKHLTSETCLQALQFLFSRVENIKAIICDRGAENTKFKEMQRMLNTRVYACDPGCPWQKGLVEGTIRLLRKDFPGNYDYKNITNKKVYRATALFNSMYRVSLGGQTTNQVYNRITLDGYRQFDSDLAGFGI